MNARYLLLCVFLAALKLGAQQYDFCVTYAVEGAFKSEVYLQDLDLGAWAARSMLKNELNARLGKDNYTLSNYQSSTCPCGDTCAIFKVSPQDWDGNWSDNEMSMESTLGTITEVGNKLVGEGRALWRDPGGYLAERFFKRAKPELL